MFYPSCHWPVEKRSLFNNDKASKTLSMGIILKLGLRASQEKLFGIKHCFFDDVIKCTAIIF